MMPEPPEAPLTGPARNGQAGEQPPLRPHFGRALRLALTGAYDHLGLVAAATFLWGLVIGLPVVGAAALVPGVWAWVACGLLGIVGGAVANAGLFHLAHLIGAREPASLGAMLRGVREFGWSSLRLAALWAAMAGVILFSAGFYLNVLARSRLAMVIGFISLYLFGLLCLVSLYAYPLLVVRRQGPLAALKNSALLALDNIGFTLLFAFFAMGVTAVIGLPILAGIPYLVGLSALILLFIHAGFFALLANHALLELLKKY